ncbi:MAG: lactonase family protein [Planctomycetia bacterium]|nr:lactonase family protein [Planctomycetia bacterium]
MKFPFFIGTMNRPADLSPFPFSEGITAATLDTETGALEPLRTETVARLESPTFLGVHPTLPVLYACSSAIPGKLSGELTVKSENATVKSGNITDTEDILTAYRIHVDGTLTLISEIASGGKNPCHICVHPSGKWLFSPNYSSGVTACVSLNVDGSFSGIQHWKHPAEGSDHLVLPSAVTGRQECSHPHCCAVSPDGRFVMECDLGCDRIWIWTAKKCGENVLFDENPAEKISAGENLNGWELSAVQPYVDAPRGSGPRHAVFSRTKNQFYVFTELACTLDIYDFEPENGRLTYRNSIPVLSDCVSGKTEGRREKQSVAGQGAEIVRHPTEAFLYLSTRIADRITVFREMEIGVETGKFGMETVQSISAGGEIPRFIDFDPTGRFLVSCCQKTGRITSFYVSETDGTLRATGFSLFSPWCACVSFVNSGKR